MNSLLLSMTKLLEQAVEVVRDLSPEVQDDLARILLQLAGKDQPVIQLSAAEEASLAESLAQADRGEFATDEQVRAIWAKYDL
jgi:predicted transcriptional regulator